MVFVIDVIALSELWSLNVFLWGGNYLVMMCRCLYGYVLFYVIVVGCLFVKDLFMFFNVVDVVWFFGVV